MTENVNGEATEGAQDPESEGSETVDLVAEVEKWKGFSRKWEERSKANLQELNKLKGEKEAASSEELVSAVANARKDAEDAQREAAMLRIAIAHKLTADDLELLTYVPLDELAGAAEKLAARMRRTPDLGQGVGQAAAPQTDMNSLMRKAAGLA